MQQFIKLDALENKDTKTYVLDDSVVKLTGKYAERKTKSVSDVLYEVEVVESKSKVKWKKWVRYESLYEVKTYEKA